MPLLGSAAMLLTFDVVAEAIAEHDHWHTHEHLSERLSIPGFIRGSRWVAAQRHPRYLVIYEVEELATLTSSAYLQRLNNPSPWTAKMMPHYRGMTRGLASAHLLEGAVTPAMTNEQRIRGADATVDWALVLTGYSQNAVMDLADPRLCRNNLLSAEQLERSVSCTNWNTYSTRASSTRDSTLERTAGYAPSISPECRGANEAYGGFSAGHGAI